MALAEIKSFETKERKKNQVLEWAWQRFGTYDSNAIQLKKDFKRFQILILLLGVLATLLALMQTQLLSAEVFKGESRFKEAFQYAIVSLPLIVSILIAASNRSKPGYKSIMLRAGAEAIKREIYRYRVHAEMLRNPNIKNTKEIYDEETLAEKINNINNNLMQTELKATGLTPYEGPIPPKNAASPDDDGFKALTPDDYVKYRVVDQLNYYQSRSKVLGKQLSRLNWYIYIFGGLGTLLAAVGLELWVALTTSIVGVFTTYMEYQQIENTLIIYNRAATSLSGIKARWDALSPVKKDKNILKLLQDSEDTLLAEHSQWIRQMEEAIANLRSQQSAEEPQAAREPGNQGSDLRN